MPSKLTSDDHPSSSSLSNNNTNANQKFILIGDSKYFENKVYSFLLQEIKKFLAAGWKINFYNLRADSAATLMNIPSISLEMQLIDAYYIKHCASEMELAGAHLTNHDSNKSKTGVRQNRVNSSQSTPNAQQIITSYHAYIELLSFIFNHSAHIKTYSNEIPTWPDQCKTVTIMMVDNNSLSEKYSIIRTNNSDAEILTFTNDPTLTSRLQHCSVELLNFDTHPTLCSWQQIEEGVNQNNQEDSSSIDKYTAEKILDNFNLFVNNFKELKGVIDVLMQKNANRTLAPAEEKSLNDFILVYKLIAAESAKFGDADSKNTLELLFAMISLKFGNREKYLETLNNINTLLTLIAREFHANMNAGNDFDKIFEVNLSTINKLKKLLQSSDKTDPAKLFLITAFLENVFFITRPISFHQEARVNVFFDHYIELIKNVLQASLELGIYQATNQFFNLIKPLSRHKNFTSKIDSVYENIFTLLEGTSDFTITVRYFNSLFVKRLLETQENKRIEEAHYRFLYNYFPQMSSNQPQEGIDVSTTNCNNFLNEAIETLIGDICRLFESKKIKATPSAILFFYLHLLFHSSKTKNGNNTLLIIALVYELYVQTHKIPQEKVNCINAYMNEILPKEILTQVSTLLGLLHPLKLTKVDALDFKTNPLQFQVDDAPSGSNCAVVYKRTLISIDKSPQDDKLLITLSSKIFRAKNDDVKKTIDAIFQIMHFIKICIHVEKFITDTLGKKIAFKNNCLIVEKCDNSDYLILQKAVSSVFPINNFYTMKLNKGVLYINFNLDNGECPNLLSLTINPIQMVHDETQIFRDNYSALERLEHQQKPVFNFETCNYASHLIIKLNSSFANVDIASLNMNYSWLSLKKNQFVILIDEMYKTPDLFKDWIKNLMGAFENKSASSRIEPPSTLMLQHGTKPKNPVKKDMNFLVKLNNSFKSFCESLQWNHDEENDYYHLTLKKENYNVTLPGMSDKKGKGKANMQTLDREMIIHFIKNTIFQKSDTLQISHNSIQFTLHSISASTKNRLMNKKQCFRGIEKLIEQKTKEKNKQKCSTNAIVSKLKTSTQSGSSSSNTPIRKMATSTEAESPLRASGSSTDQVTAGTSSDISKNLKFAESLRIMLNDIYRDYQDFIVQEEKINSPDLSYIYKNRLLYLLFILTGQYLQELSYAYHLEKQQNDKLLPQHSKSFEYVNNPDNLYPWCLFILKGVQTVSSDTLIELVQLICLANQKIELPELPEKKSTYLSKSTLASCITSELAELERLTNLKHDVVKNLQAKLNNKPYDAYEILAHILSLITHFNKLSPQLKSQPEIKHQLDNLFCNLKKIRNEIRHHPERLFTKTEIDPHSLGQFMQDQDKPFTPAYQYKPDPIIINDIIFDLRNLKKIIGDFEEIVDRAGLASNKKGKEKVPTATDQSSNPSF